MSSALIPSPFGCQSQLEIKSCWVPAALGEQWKDKHNFQARNRVYLPRGYQRVLVYLEALRIVRFYTK